MYLLYAIMAFSGVRDDLLPYWNLPTEFTGSWAHHGAFSSLEAFYNYLFGPASAHAFKSDIEYQKTLSHAKRLQSHQHRMVFTHGDFKAHNILVDDDGHLSRFLDWESAGWYPEYWEFTTATRFGKDSWWFQVASWMGGSQYWDELDSDVDLNLLTVDSYIAL